MKSTVTPFCYNNFTSFICVVSATVNSVVDLIYFFKTLVTTLSTTNLTSKNFTDSISLTFMGD